MAEQRMSEGSLSWSQIAEPGVGKMIPITKVYIVEQPVAASYDCARIRLHCLRRANAMEQGRRSSVMVFGGHYYAYDGEISTRAPI